MLTLLLQALGVRTPPELSKQLPMLNKKDCNDSKRGSVSTPPSGYREHGEGIKYGVNWQTSGGGLGTT
jgi:hypothetical protein